MTAGDEAYRRALAGTVRAKADQVRAFVDYVVEAHSWYKHLPVFPPGARFVFFIDPNAGRERVDGQYRDCTVDTPEQDRFHYTWQPTDTYRAAYGHLQYHTDHGTSFLVHTRTGVLDTASVPYIIDDDGRTVGLPPAVVDAGTVFLTNTIHPYARNASPWLVMTGNTRRYGHLPFIELPLHPPTDPVQREKWEFLRSLTPADDDDHKSPKWQQFLEECVAPDAQRQKELIAAAIEAMLNVVYQDAT